MDPHEQQKTLRKFQGTQLGVGNNQYLLIHLVSEKHYPELGERQAVFYAQRIRDLAAAVVKIRLHLDPQLLTDEHIPGVRQSILDWAKSIFEHEIRVLQSCSDIREILMLFDHQVLEQTREYEYPGGYLDVIAMERMPGLPATEYTDLGDDEALMIKEKVREVLEKVRLNGWEFDQGFPDKIIYERETRKVSVTCLAHTEEQDPAEEAPIEPDDGTLWEFGLNVWRF